MKKTIHNKCDQISEMVEWLFHVIPFKQLRHTENVDFEVMSFFEEFNWVDIVKHESWARSPWAINWEWDYWYMHPHQEDNLITLNGNRHVELYTKEHWKIEHFEISYEWIKRNWKTILDWPWILGWPVNVFHRNYSPEWSISMNFAVRSDDFDIDTEFNIYDLNSETWEYSVAREGKLDQPK
jgi:hypothetical protein